MMHDQIVIDTDPCFLIDISTREIKNMTLSKTVIMQFDHNSERFGFSMPRFVEGHDMSQCDKVEVHFVNEDVQKKEQIKDKYKVEDLQIDPEDEDKIKFTWLLSGNTSKLEGNLVFSIRFTCLEEDKIDYSWGTAPCSSILVGKGLNVDEYLINENPDAFKKLEKELQAYIDESVSKTPSKVDSLYYYGDMNITPDVGVFRVCDKYDNGTCSILLDDGFDGEELVVPYNIDGYGVEIVFFPLEPPQYLKHVIFPEGVTIIIEETLKYSNIESVSLPSSLKTIERLAFAKTDLTDIYFRGTEEQWGKIDIDMQNSDVENATKHFANSMDIEIDEKPTEGSKNAVSSGGVYEYVKEQIGDIDTTLENIIAKYGLGGDAE